MGMGCADSNQDSIVLLVNSAYPDSLFFLKKIFFIYYFHSWLCWIFIAARKLSSGFSLWRPLLWSTSWGAVLAVHRLSTCGSQASVLAVHRLSTCGSQASVLAAHGLSCLLAGGVFPDQGLDRGPLHCKVDHWTTCNLDSLFITTFIFTVHHTPARMGRILTTNPQT